MTTPALISSTFVFQCRGENLENETKLFDQAVAKGIHIFTPTEFFRFLGTRSFSYYAP
jgi:hypothetical protein